MKQLSKWYYWALFTVPLGIVLCLLFGILGLCVFSIINLAFCNFLPDNFLFLKAPDSVSHFSRKQIYKAEDAIICTMGLAFFLLPALCVAICFFFSVEDISNFILGKAHWGIVNDTTIKSATFAIIPSQTCS